MLRVVSLPPTISKPKLPMNSSIVMFWIASAWAIIEIKSNFGSSAARSSHSTLK
ncbi:MAG: hypothetical protein OSB46_11710 [Alphaproteobacteria bacterium]|nr:hypothetical protein [Alphaproteobacteria bacterium]